MKHYLKPTFVLAGALLTASSFLNAGTVVAPVATDPVGYVTVDVKGNGGTTLLSNAGLLQPVSAAGLGTVTGGNTLTVPSGAWVPSAFAGSHYVQLSTGEWAAVSANTETQLTLETALPDGTDLSFVVRPLNTINSLFGDTNSAGFTGGANIGVSDILGPWDAGIQNLSGFYYYNTTRSRWEDASNSPAGSTIIYPDESILVIGQQDISVTFTGSVQLDSTSGELFGSGATAVVPNPYAVDLKISETGYESSLQGASTFADADWVLTWSAATQSFTKFYFYDTDDNTWKDASNVAVTDLDVIPVGSAAVIVKNSVGQGTWSTSQPFNL